MDFLRKIFSKSKTINKNSEISCPYCKVNLDPFSERKKKCSNCWNMIIIKKLPITEEKVLTTEKEAIQIDKEWGEIYFKRKWLRELSVYTITEEDFQRESDSLKKGTNGTPSCSDIIWWLFNKLISETKDFQDLKLIYYSMALFLNENWNDPFIVLQKSSSMELMNYKSHWFMQKVEILSCWDDSCDSCKKLHWKIFDIETAIKEQPIPCKECSHKIWSDWYGFCRCTYVAKIN